ncbi:MAG TPA: leucyl/phenylalanyl-tRNA--protein transferase, partial [Pirellulaceae bacterium]|nr:leucyl/phenylalanyl-tRNA--protein transferase [Pirellulaceae bacterium]
KAAVAIIARHLARRGYSLFDIQQSTPHLVAMGAIEFPRRDFLARLAEALPRPCSLGPPGPIDISDYFFGDQG